MTQKSATATVKTATPTIKRRRVGAQLRRWRGTLKSGEAAKLMSWDTTRLSRVERGLYKISAEDVRKLAELYGVIDADGVEEVARVAEEPPGAGWWRPYVGRVSDRLIDFIDLEADAATVRMQHRSIVPGPLQSPGYVREMIGRAPMAVPPDRAETLVSIRLARQEILTRTQHPVNFHALVPESAFHATFESGPAIMRDQLRRLLDLSELPNITIQILPMTTHPAFGSNGASTILTFRRPWVPVASVDNPMGGTHTEDPDQVSYLETEFAGIARVALPADKSRDLISEHLEGLHT
ncbi:helix-turn-helix domain-containing protein [Streptomyces sp. NPDC059928]|uniref:helix-turn-helix domain-containing protein n=1 Tax=unclassified Streptomyces TaxID=2593676 RepID=UPI003664F577